MLYSEIIDSKIYEDYSIEKICGFRVFDAIIGIHVAYLEKLLALMRKYTLRINLLE